MRKLIPALELKYAGDIKSTVYTPSEYVSSLVPALFKLVDRRNRYAGEAYSTKLLLAKFNRLPLAELAAYKAGLEAVRSDEYCWLRAKLPVLESTVKGFEQLHGRQAAALEKIVAENDIERRRASAVEKELLRRKRKYMRIVSNNTHVANVKIKAVNKSKHSYLSTLKRQRRRKS